MKNFWLITGGIALGYGIMHLKESYAKKIDDLDFYHKDQKQKAMINLAASVFLIGFGLYGFDKK